MPAPAIARPTRQGVAPETNRRTTTETGVRRKAAPAAESPTRESYIREVAKTDRASYRPPAPPAGRPARKSVAPKPLKKAEPAKGGAVAPRASLASIPAKAKTPSAARPSVSPPKAKLPSVPPPPRAKLSSMPPPKPAATPSSPPPVPADAKRSSMPPPAPQAPVVAQAPAPPLIPAEAVRASMPPPPPAPEAPAPAPARTPHVLASAPPLAFPEADEPVDFAAIGVRRSIVPEPLAKVASDVRGSLAPEGRAEAKRQLRSMLIAALQGTRRLLDRLAEITVNLELRLRG